MRRWMAMMCGLAMLSASALAQQEASETVKALMSVEAGDYLYRGYAESVKRTLSPLASRAIGDGPQVVTVHRNGNNLSLVAAYNWHEGCGLVAGRVGESNPVSLKYGDCSNRPEFRDAGPLGFEMDGSRYDFVGNAGHYIGAVVLGGVYADDQGRRYSFGADGKAAFPEKKFDYELCLDQVGPPCSIYDSFDDLTNHVSYVFKRSDNSLALYEAPPGEYDDADYAKPLVVLHRISGK